MGAMETVELTGSSGELPPPQYTTTGLFVAPATAAAEIRPGLATTEFSLVTGVPILDVVVNALMGSEALPPNWRYLAYGLVAVYTICRSWLKRP